jgi:hypothetical protein
MEKKLLEELKPIKLSIVAHAENATPMDGRL